MNNGSYDLGMIGLGVMGRNLLLNVADHGYFGIGFDKDPAKGAALLSSAKDPAKLRSAESLADLVNHLRLPRKLMMLVPAGPIVDSVISEILPLLNKGDILIDAGNSHYSDTLRRIANMSDKGIHFVGMGVSGGEQGARNGPCIMPGGDKEAWMNMKPLLESIAAKVNDSPCVGYMGKAAAGHYVKMVHNGIEYAVMQLISETYDLLKRGAGYTNDELNALFSEWNKGEMRSFLLEITAAVFLQPDPESGQRLIDMILDKAGAKGTGKWTAQEAMNIAMPVPGIDIAVSMRDISLYKTQRVAAFNLYKPKVRAVPADRAKFILLLHDALACSTILAYAQGLVMLRKASVEFKMEVPVQDVARIWQGGCIIRSAYLELFTSIFKKDPQLENVLLHKKVAAIVKRKQSALRKVIQRAAVMGIPAGGFMNALTWLDASCAEKLPTNLIQAQRDYFGAHGYQRTDKEGNFHTEW